MITMLIFSLLAAFQCIGLVKSVERKAWPAAAEKAALFIFFALFAAAQLDPAAMTQENRG